MTETITPTEDWTDEQIAARADAPMPEVPTKPGIGDVDQNASAEQLAVAAAAAQGTAAAMIAQAHVLLGTREQPMGSNHAPPVTTWYGAGNVSWCDESISYEAAHSGNASAVGGKYAYCPSHTRWFDAHGEWAYGGNDLRPGDVVFFEWNGHRTRDADHVGLVEHRFSDGSFYSLEGNHNDQFMRVHRDRTYVAGRGRPHYAGGSGGGSSSGDAWPGRYLQFAKGTPMMTGADVKWVQEHLNKHGHQVTVDSAYGAKTAATVVVFQHGANLTQDGVVGAKTWGALK